MNYIAKRMRRFCGYLAGFVFYISGLLKLLDPVGAGLVMDEYFNFFHVGFLGFAAKPAGVFLAFVETVIGAALITGVWRRITGISAFILQGFFTLLTLILVIFNPEMDCGCFGEAIHLTHFQTFLKNIVLMLLLVGDFVPLRDLGEPKGRKYVSFGIVMLSTLVFTIYSLIYIPLIDFTAYKTTALLEAADSGTEEEDIYEAVFIYEKDGKQQTFDLDHLPDSTWTFVSTETIMKEEYTNQTISLSFHNAEGEYLDTLATKGRVMVFSVYNPDIKESKWKKIELSAEKAAAQGFHTLILVSGTPSTVDCPIERDIYYSDYKTLITLNRSNGGVTYFNDGYLIRKWAEKASPDSKELNEVAMEAVTETMIGHSSQGSLIFQSFLLYVFAILLLL